MSVKLKQAGNWQEFWEVMGQNKDPIAATDRPTVTFEAYQAYCRDIEQKLALQPDDILLDIGCGTGLIDVFLSSRVKKVIATDYAFNMAKVTQNNTQNLSNTYALTCPANPTPFPDHTFTKVLIYAVTQYLSGPEFFAILCELKRITKSGGMIFFGEIPRGRDENFLTRVKDVWTHEGSFGTLKKIRDRTIEITLISLGRYFGSDKYIRPIGPPTWHPYPEELTALVAQTGMESQVLPQAKDLPWFHQTFDLLVINE